MRTIVRCVAWICLLLMLFPGVGHAQEASPQDQAIDAISGRSDIGESDQGRIARWVEMQVSGFTTFEAFRDKLKDRYTNPGNSQQFRLHLAAQASQVAAARFATPDMSADIARALAQVLIDMDRPETFPGLIAGLKSSDATTSYLCARGLSAERQKTSIAADGAKLVQTVDALREVALAGLDPVALGRIYEALGYRGQVSAVFETYLNLFDKRLNLRRGGAVLADGAESFAFDFFQQGAVRNALSADQKAQLAGRLAVFLRLDAERYNTADLPFAEIDKLERTLSGAEEILAAIVGSDGGQIREAIKTGGHGSRAAVLREAYRWVGDPKANTPGAVNQAPWNVPVGAP